MKRTLLRMLSSNFNMAENVVHKGKTIIWTSVHYEPCFKFLHQLHVDNLSSYSKQTIKVKVKLFLVNPMQTEGNGGIAPSILKRGTRGKCVISFILWPLNPPGKNHNTHWIESWVGYKASLEVWVKRKILPCQNSNPSHSSHSLITVMTAILA